MDVGGYVPVSRAVLPGAANSPQNYSRIDVAVPDSLVTENRVYGTVTANSDCERASLRRNATERQPAALPPTVASHVSCEKCRTTQSRVRKCPREPIEAK